MKYEHLKQLVDDVENMDSVLNSPLKPKPVTIEYYVNKGVRAQQELFRFGVDFGDTSDV